MLAGDLMGTVGVRATPRVRWCRRDAYCSRVARAGGSRSERGNIGMGPRWIPACPYPSAWVPGLSQSVSTRGAMGLGLGKAAGLVSQALESTVERGSVLLRLTCRLEIYRKRRDYLAVSVCGRSPLRPRYTIRPFFIPLVPIYVTSSPLLAYLVRPAPMPRTSSLT